MSDGPLTGVRVVDLTHNLAGPLTAMHLGDLGAEVIKVERPEGDEWREHEVLEGHPGRSRHYLQINRNKRSLVLDLTTDQDREVLGRLVDRADVLVTNMRTGVPERLGFGWDQVAPRNPRLIYCRLTAFGELGPIAERRGYDMVVEARAGFLVDGLRPEDPPRSSIVPIMDTALPLHAAMSVMAALFERERSGLGQRIDLSLLQSAVALNAHALVRLDDHPGDGVAQFNRATYRTYPTTDGWLAIGAIAEHMVRALVEAIGLTGMLDDARFATKADRVRNEDAFAEAIGAAIVTRSTSEWEALLNGAGVPAGPVNHRDRLFEDPQVLAMSLTQEVSDEELGRVTMVSPVSGLSRTPGRIRFPARHLGEDTAEIRAELEGRDKK